MAVVMTVYSAVGQGLSYGLLALGVYLTFKILNFADLTCDGAFATGGCVTIVLTQEHKVNPFLSLLVAFLAGCAAGCVTGLLNTKMKIPPILAGILTMISLYSVNLHIMSGRANLAIQRNVSSIVDSVRGLFPQGFFGKMLGVNVDYTIVLILGIVFGGAVVAFLYWYFGTEIGAATRATGSNEDMVKALGQDIDVVKILTLALSVGLITLSGGLIAQQRRVADITSGQGAIVIGLASIVIGEVLFGHKTVSFSVKLACIIGGSVIYQVVTAIVLFLGLNTMDLKILTAIVVAVALSIPTLRNMRRNGYRNALRRAEQASDKSLN